MKYILKGSSPIEFEDWKNQANDQWQPSWDNFQNPEKKKVKEALLIEQGYICCYCGMRVENDVYTEIEHIKLRQECVDSEAYKALDFKNFLASCNGSTKEPKPREVHCNNARSNQFLAINPLNPVCEDKFIYTYDGMVIPSNPSDNDIANLIDSVLRLNAKKIKNFREKLIHALDEDFRDATLADIEDEIYALSQKDNNRFHEMCFVSVSYLKSNML
ncbi:MAG: TIGR02646 family protein [Methylococcaceae bacterium]|nr:TIGR02646 family protein [Methylococcaceae bacterium]